MTNALHVRNQSKHVVVARRCGFKTFGRRTNKNAGVSHLFDQEKMVALYEKGKIFPIPSTPTRKFTGGFFWDLIDRLTNVSSEKTKNFERTEWTPAETMLHSQL